MRIKRFNESLENEENSKEFYLISLEDAKPSYSEVKAVDKETWDWIHSPSDRPNPNPSYQWDDTNASPELRQRIIDYSNEQSEGFGGETTTIDISSGAWQNDRAIYAVPIKFGDDDYADCAPDFKSTRELVDRLNNLGFQGPIDQYDGHLY